MLMKFLFESLCWLGKLCFLLKFRIKTANIKNLFGLIFSTKLQHKISGKDKCLSKALFYPRIYKKDFSFYLKFSLNLALVYCNSHE